MYAVIRSGGKQYRVAPGEVVHLEKLSPDAGGQVEWRGERSEVLAIRDDQGAWAPLAGARVTGTVLAQARAAKILVFHFKRKKQYKKLQGHRQRFTRVRVDNIQLPA